MFQKKPTGRVNFIWVAMGLILLEEAVRVGMSFDEASSPATNIFTIALFVFTAVLLLYREWRSFQYGRAKKKDPNFDLETSRKKSVSPSGNGGQKKKKKKK